MKVTKNKITSMSCNCSDNREMHLERMPEYLSRNIQELTKPHVHAFYEIIWFKEGGGIHTVDFKDYKIQPNSIFFIAPGQVHCFDKAPNNKGAILKFCNDFMSMEDNKEDVFVKYNMFNGSANTPYCILDEEVTPKIESIIKEMEQEEKKNDKFGHIDMLRSLTKQLFIYIHRYSTKKDEMVLEEKRPSHRLFVRFRRMLEENYKSKHLVAEYAAELNVSTKTLSNSVTECTGIPPLTFINDRILLEAKRLLLYSNMMTKEVAFNLGFDDPSYFSKFFKRHTGYLPSEYKYKKE